ncbi:CotY/CotZ family spore coat protein [Virgibacillus alimentarius]|uniref:Spore coat protein Z n=1 Tax=Virgibacillus alimentarius TaxID=698769 RepID=A0ABS4S9Y2_9BACI|nr:MULTISPECIES: CotY/CotZ family spore coat protein [Virgibacillus]MBP2257212.1 spore coat protein Z [Virgibacillus alimentarius]HLR67404.1 CotY/CotZ family spore coat protein [Virgibacillus sp.]
MGYYREKFRRHQEPVHHHEHGHSHCCNSQCQCSKQESCVCDTVKKIIREQDRVTEENENCCSTGCEQSIKDLLSPNRNRNNFTTVPFMLYCKGNCDVFKAKGVTKDWNFICVESSIFKAKRFVKGGSGCCVELELLEFQQRAHHGHHDHHDHHDHHEHHDYHNHPHYDDCFSVVPPNNSGKLIETGICITVDLHSFNGIACLPATKPLAR